MVQRITRLFSRIADDLANLKNIEKYAVAFAAFFFALWAVVGPDSDFIQRYESGIIAAALGVLVFSLTAPEVRPGDIDDYLHDRSEFNDYPFLERLKGKKELWIYGASAVNVLNGNNRSAILDNLLNTSEGRLRVIVQDPQEEAAVQLLVQQLDVNTKQKVQDLPVELENIQRTFDNFDRMQQNGTFSGEFEARFLAFNPGFSLVLFNPKHRDGIAIVEFYGYANRSTGSRMHLTIHKSESEQWFTYWVEQYERMWEDARQREVAG